MIKSVLAVTIIGIDDIFSGRKVHAGGSLCLLSNPKVQPSTNGGTTKPEYNRDR